jgi:hypothetical protein
VRGAYAPFPVSSLALSWVRCCAVRSSAARTAIAAGSSTRSGSPCLSRDRRASSAPARRIAARSSGLSGPRGGRRTSRLLADGAWSVVGHHLPETTRRRTITSLPAARKSDRAARVSARRSPRSPGQYHRVIKSLRNWQDCRQRKRASPGHTAPRRGVTVW